MSNQDNDDDRLSRRARLRATAAADEYDGPLAPLDAVVPAGERLAVVLHQGTVSGREVSPTPTPVMVETGGDATLTMDAWTPSEEGTEEPPRGPPEGVPGGPAP